MFNLIVFLRQSSGCWISVIQASVIQSSNPWQSKPFVTEALILWPGSSSVLIELDCFKNGKLTVTCNLPFLCYFSSTRVFDFCIKKKRGRGRCCFLLQYSYSGRRDLFTCRWVSIRHMLQYCLTAEGRRGPCCILHQAVSPSGCVATNWQRLVCRSGGEWIQQIDAAQGAGGRGRMGPHILAAIIGKIGVWSNIVFVPGLFIYCLLTQWKAYF